MKKYPLSSGYFLLSTLKRLERAAAFYREKNINFAAMVKTRRSVGNNDANHTSPTTPSSSSSSSANEKIDEFDYTQDPLFAEARKWALELREGRPELNVLIACPQLPEWAAYLYLKNSSNNKSLTQLNSKNFCIELMCHCDVRIPMFACYFTINIIISFLISSYLAEFVHACMHACMH